MWPGEEGTERVLVSLKMQVLLFLKRTPFILKIAPVYHTICPLLFQKLPSLA